MRFALAALGMFIAGAVVGKALGYSPVEIGLGWSISGPQAVLLWRAAKA